MAKIDSYTNQIRSAVYGREVRGSIVSALTECSKESGEAVEIASQANKRAASADKKTEEALQAAKSAHADSVEAKTAAAQAAQNTAEAMGALKKSEEYIREVADPNKAYAIATEANKLASANKDKLDQMEPKAQVNKLETVKINGSPLKITDKAISFTIPTTLSSLNDDVGVLKETRLATAEDIRATIKKYAAKK